MVQTSAGTPLPLGATLTSEGANFSLFSRHASAVELLLFTDAAATQPLATIPVTDRTLDYWCVHVRGTQSGAVYAWRVDGPPMSTLPTQRGNRFDRQKVLIDPYGLGHVDDLYVEADASRPGDNVATSLRSVVIDPGSYDWEGDVSPRTPWRDTVIYELHVRGFTRDPSSGIRNPGTFAGLIEKLPYIRDLGVTAIELMPTFQFDGRRVIRNSPTTGEALRNYWGYDPIAFFAPHSGYCVSPTAGAHLDEFRDLVKAAHRAGLEVILDVVFNHSGERNEAGPTLCFRGIDNAVYYMVSGDDGAGYLDLTGVLNTMNCGHPVMADLIRDVLAHWVEAMHVDGFRFDLASILMVDDTGRRLDYPPALWACRLDPRLAGIKLIAEPFGSIDSLADFPDDRFATWNYRLRDTVRHFVRGDRGIVAEVATRIAGSSDFYQGQGKTPLNGISYVTCHDGMTLNDVVTYSRPHNEANGEVSGNQSEVCANYGSEGPDQTLEILRRQQIKNHFVVLLLSQGIPMLLAGDECRRTQQGNNNPYLQDNAISWFDWTLPAREAELVRFVRELIAFRKRHESLRRDSFFTGEVVERGLRDIAWHGCNLDQPGFGDPNSGVLAFTIAGRNGAEDLHAILNMEPGALSFALPSISGRSWFKAIDTSQRGPADIMPAGSETPVATARLDVPGRTAAVLVAR